MTHVQSDKVEWILVRMYFVILKAACAWSCVETCYGHVNLRELGGMGGEIARLCR